MRLFIKCFLVLLTILSSLSIKTSATHLAGYEIDYHLIDSNTIFLQVYLYRDCSGISAPATLPFKLFSHQIPSNQAGGVNVPITYQLTRRDNQQPFPGLSPLDSAISTRQTGTNVCNTFVDTSCCLQFGSNCVSTYETYVFSDTLSIPSTANEWVFTCYQSAIPNDVTNFGGFGYQLIQLNLDVSVWPQKSPVWYQRDNFVVAVNAPGQMQVGGYNPDQDSISYSLDTFYFNYNSPGVYQPGYAYNFLFSGQTAPNTIDHNGLLRYHPVNQENCYAAIKIEKFRNGQKVATIRRTKVIRSTVMAGGNASISEISNIHTFGPSGIPHISFFNDTASFSIQIYDSAYPNNTSIDAWISTDFLAENQQELVAITHLGGPLYEVEFKVATTSFSSDTIPLSIRIRSQNCPYTLNTNFPVILLKGDCDASLPDTLKVCQEGYPLPSLPGTENFSWFPASWVNNDTIQSPVTAGLNEGFIYASSDVCADTMFLDTIQSFSLDLGNDTLVCPDDLLPLTPTIGNQQAPYQISWLSNTDTLSLIPGGLTTMGRDEPVHVINVTGSNGCSMIDSLTVLGFSQIQLTATDNSCQNPAGGMIQSVVSPSPISYAWNDSRNQTTATAGQLQAGTYTLTVSYANGCSDTASATVNGSSFYPVWSQSDTAACFGEQFSFTLDSIVSNTSISYPGTGLYPIPSNSGSNAVIVPDSAYLFSGSPTWVITNYAGWKNYHRIQYLFTKRELNDQGLSSGLIKGLSFVHELYASHTVQDVDISMRAISDTVLTGWIPNCFAVAASGPLTLSPSRDTTYHSFDTGFYWDGQSSLIVEVLSFSPTNGNFSKRPYGNTTPVDRVAAFQEDQINDLYVNPPTLSLDRPMVIFDISSDSSNQTDFVTSWGPVSDLDSVVGNTAYFTKSLEDWYFIRLEDSATGCYVIDSVNMNGAGPIVTIQSDTVCYDSAFSHTVSAQPVNGAWTYTWNSTSGQQSGANANINFNYTDGISNNISLLVDDGNCISTFSHTLITDTSCVWPGDMNRDGLVDNFDVFAFSANQLLSGPSRMNQGGLWQPYLSEDWTNSINGFANAKHADADGSGLVDGTDFNLITQNYSSSHLKGAGESEGPRPVLIQTWNKDTFAAGDTAIAIFEIQPQDSAVHSIVFRNYFTPAWAVPNSVEFDFDGVFGTQGVNLNAFALPQAEGTEYHWGFVPANTSLEVDTAGRFAAMQFIVDDTLIEGLADTTIMIQLNIFNPQAMTLSNSMLGVDVVNYVAFISNKTTGISNRDLPGFSIFPNPATESVTIELDQVGGELRLSDLIGNQIQTKEANSRKVNFKIDHLPAGTYLIEYELGGMRKSKRLIKH